MNNTDMLIAAQHAHIAQMEILAYLNAMISTLRLAQAPTEESIVGDGSEMWPFVCGGDLLAHDIAGRTYMYDVDGVYYKVPQETSWGSISLDGCADVVCATYTDKAHIV
jgi:hypothetical protein